MFNSRSSFVISLIAMFITALLAIPIVPMMISALKIEPPENIKCDITLEDLIKND